MNDVKVLSSFFFHSKRKNEHPFISNKDRQRTLSLNLPHLPLKKSIDKQNVYASCVYTFCTMLLRL